MLRWTRVHQRNIQCNHQTARLELQNAESECICEKLGVLTSVRGWPICQTQDASSYCLVAHLRHFSCSTVMMQLSICPKLNRTPWTEAEVNLLLGTIISPAIQVVCSLLLLWPDQCALCFGLWGSLFRSFSGRCLNGQVLAFAPPRRFEEQALGASQIMCKPLSLW